MSDAAATDLSGGTDPRAANGAVPPAVEGQAVGARGDFAVGPVGTVETNPGLSLRASRSSRCRK